MATLAGKTVLVVGGSAGIGYGVAKAALLSRAAHVIISSSTQQKVDAALSKLNKEVIGHVEGTVSGKTVDGRDSASVKALLAYVGELDHLVWTSGDPLRLGSPTLDLDQHKDIFDVRFWGAFTAAQVAKIRPGGSITFTIGAAYFKPPKGWSLMTSTAGAIDGLTRGLAVDLAPIRVNVISPGLVRTELWDHMSQEARDQHEESAKSLLVQRVADSDEMAEAYLFVMKCGYITGQCIEVDGGLKYT